MGTSGGALVEGNVSTKAFQDLIMPAVSGAGFLGRAASHPPYAERQWLDFLC